MSFRSTGWKNQRTKVIVEPAQGMAYDGWFALFPSGQIEWFQTPEEVVARVRRRDRGRMAAAKRQGQAPKALVTLIEWRKVPEGFTPPE
jgi:hypothetical protein